MAREEEEEEEEEEEKEEEDGVHTGGGEEDVAQVLVVRDVEDLPGDVHQAPHHRRNPPEVQDPAAGSRFC